MDDKCRADVEQLKLEAAKCRDSLQKALDSFVAGHTIPMAPLSIGAACFTDAVFSAATVHAGLSDLLNCPNAGQECVMEILAARAEALEWFTRLRDANNRISASWLLMVFGPPAVAHAQMAIANEFVPFSKLVGLLNALDVACPREIAAQGIDPYEDVDLAVNISPTDGTKFGSPQKETVAGTHTDRRQLFVPGKFGKVGPASVWYRCTDFAVETWRIRARADVSGASTPIFGSFDFKWVVGGNPVPHTPTGPLTSTIDVVVPAGASVKIELTATGIKGNVTETVNDMTKIAVPTKRSECKVIRGPAVDFPG